MSSLLSMRACGSTAPPPPDPASSMRVVKTVANFTSAAGVVKSAAAAIPGDLVNYSIEVCNTGQDALSNVVVADASAVVTGSPIASLAIGACATVTAQRTVTAADIAARSISNQATATGTDPQGNVIAASSQSTGDGSTGPTVLPIGCDTTELLTNSEFNTLAGWETVPPGSWASDGAGNAVYFLDNGAGPISRLRQTVQYPAGATAPQRIEFCVRGQDGSGGATTGRASLSLEIGGVAYGTFTNPAGTAPITFATLNGATLVAGPASFARGTDQCYVLQIPTPAAGPVSVAFAAWYSSTPGDDWWVRDVSFVGSNCPLGPNPAPSLTLVKTAVVNPTTGVITYTFTATNTGPTNVSNLAITDAAIGVAGIAMVPASIPPGGTATLTRTYTPTAADFNTGTGTKPNQATVSGVDALGTAATAPSSAAVGQPPGPTVTPLPCRAPANPTINWDLNTCDMPGCVLGNSVSEWLTGATPVMGPGLTVNKLLTTWNVTGATEATPAAALAAGDWMEFPFTTTGRAPQLVLDQLWHWMSTVNGQHVNLADNYAVMIDEDPAFGSPTVLRDGPHGGPLVMGNWNTRELNDYPLAPNTSYRLRIVPYNITGGNFIWDAVVLRFKCA